MDNLGLIVGKKALAWPDQEACDDNDNPEHDQRRHMVAAGWTRGRDCNRRRFDLIILGGCHDDLRSCLTSTLTMVVDIAPRGILAAVPASR